MTPLKFETNFCYSSWQQCAWHHRYHFRGNGTTETVSAVSLTPYKWLQKWHWQRRNFVLDCHCHFCGVYMTPMAMVVSHDNVHFTNQNEKFSWEILVTTVCSYLDHTLLILSAHCFDNIFLTQTQILKTFIRPFFRGNGHHDLYKKSDIHNRSFEMHTGNLVLFQKDIQYSYRKYLFKGQCRKIFHTRYFSIKSIGPWPLIHGLRPFRIWPRICWENQQYLNFRGVIDPLEIRQWHRMHGARRVNDTSCILFVDT
jgi:hypothetical protein